jgi:energy-coupling factor transport system permease protein
MARAITIGRFIPGESPIHRLDPRTKIVVTFGFLVGLFFVQRYEGYLLMSVFVGCITMIAGFSLRTVMKGLRPVSVVVLLTLAIHLFMTEGQTLFRVGPMIATYEGLQKGILMSWRLVLLVLLSSLLTLTTSALQLTDGLESILGVGKRIGVPAHELAMMMTIALRFIPTLLDEAERIIKAQLARGATFESGSILSRLKGFIPILVPLFLSAFRDPYHQIQYWKS